MYSYKNKSILILLLFSLLITFSSCNDDDDPVIVQPMDIVDKAVATTDLSILVSALQTANLVDALKGNGPFTVFAPTNAAFEALLDSNDSWNSLTDIPSDLLNTVLLYHVANGAVASSDLSDNQTITMLSENDMGVDLSNGVELLTIS